MTNIQIGTGQIRGELTRPARSQVEPNQRRKKVEPLQSGTASRADWGVPACLGLCSGTLPDWGLDRVIGERSFAVAEIRGFC